MKINSGRKSVLKKRIIKRDGTNCYLCNESLYLSGEDNKITFDHLQPLSHGGPRHRLSNLKLTHCKCNHTRNDNDCPVCVKTGIICIDKQILKLKQIAHRLKRLENSLRNKNAKEFFDSIDMLSKI